MEVQPSTPAELAARIRNETVTWAALIKKTGIRLE
jgi:tripartite-type tricarboxylate transporter receptor subunit TctC